MRGVRLETIQVGGTLCTSIEALQRFFELLGKGRAPLMSAEHEPGDCPALAFALRYAAIGWRVMPVHVAPDGKCSCGKPACKSPGKHPRINEWPTEATTDPDIIRMWWENWPDANVGVATGQASGFWALDKDPRNGGDVSFQELGEPEASVEQQSGGGGAHLVYAYNGRQVGKHLGALPGIDVLGDGAFIVVAPSRHVSGGEYAWLLGQDPLDGAKPTPAPDALLDRLLPPEKEGRVWIPPPSVSWEQCKDRVREVLPFLPSDARDTWLRVGMALKRSGGEEEAYEVWSEWSKTSLKFDPADQRRTWDSIGEGRDRPITLRTLFYLAHKHGWNSSGQPLERDEEEDLQHLLEELDLLLQRSKNELDLSKLFDAANRVAMLPPKEVLSFIARAKEDLGERFPKTEFQRAVREEKKAQNKERREAADREAAERHRERVNQAQAGINRSAAETKRQRIDLCDDCGLAREPLEIHEDSVRALVTRNEPMRLFMRGTGLWRDVSNESDEPVLERIGEGELAAELLTAAIYVGRSRSGLPQPSNPPKPTLNTILGSARLPFPKLLGIIQAPVVRPDGSVLIKSGYDKQTRLLYIPQRGLTIPPISERPDATEVERALHLLRQPLSQFPFADGASYANALGLELTGFVQPLVQDHRPAAVIDAAQPSSGKTLLAETCARILTGRDPATTRFRKDEEFEKKLAEKLQRGSQFILIDNVKDRLESATFESLLTARRYSDRVLGHNDRGFDVAQEAVWCVTGNNISLGTEMARRGYLIRLDPRHPRPDERAGPRQGEVFCNLAKWVHENRGQAIWAALTLSRAWWVAGRPLPGLPPFGSFDTWQDIVGGILVFAGVEGFMANRQEFRTSQDQEQLEAAGLLRAILARFAAAPFTCQELVERIGTDLELREFLPEGLAGLWDLRKPGTRAQSVGQFLHKYHGRRLDDDGLRVEKAAADSHAKVGRWRVVHG